jgi:hypothetical protein
MKTFFVPVLSCLIVVCSSRAQMPGPPADGDSTNRLSVQIDLRWGTKVFHAPATMDILAYVGLRPRPRAGDVVRVEFFADAKSLGSAKAIWHDEVRPTAPPGYAVPMHILAAQFYPAEWVWKKVPAGTYALTARATWTNGLTTVSTPVNVTVLP